MLSNRGLQSLVLFGVLAVAAICQSQVQPPVATGTTVNRVAVGGFIDGGIGSGAIVAKGGIGGPAVTGKPFCADIETVRTQVLADGNRIQNTAHEHLCRDSQGRTRMEVQPMMINAPRGDLPVHTMVTIIDPTENANYTLIADQHKAIKHQFRIPNLPIRIPANQKPMPQVLAARTSAKNVSVEALGTEVINGLVAKGSRITNIIPTGAVGNEQPLTTTSETWMSEDLNQPVLTKHSDPRSGEMVREMKNITREEPEPYLFQVPADYTIEEVPSPELPPVSLPHP
jgi:hypothetical protein